MDCPELFVLTFYYPLPKTHVTKISLIPFNTKLAEKLFG